MRKPDCKHYNECLFRAALADEDLSCKDCPAYEPEEFFRMGVYEIAACKALIHAAMNPEAYFTHGPHVLVEWLLERGGQAFELEEA